jgi:hypothetical protein
MSDVRLFCLDSYWKIYEFCCYDLSRQTEDTVIVA